MGCDLSICNMFTMSSVRKRRQQSFAFAVQIAQQYAMYLAPAWLWILRALPASSRAFEARLAIPTINMAQVETSACIEHCRLLLQ
jgi:hypothetical protein